MTEIKSLLSKLFKQESYMQLKELLSVVNLYTVYDNLSCINLKNNIDIEKVKQRNQTCKAIPQPFY